MPLPEYNALILTLQERENRIAELEREFGRRQHAGPSEVEVEAEHDQRVINGISCVISGDEILQYFEEDNQLGNVIGMVRPDGTAELFASGLPVAVSGIRDMDVAFTDGQMIVHPLQLRNNLPMLETAWVGIYDSTLNVIVHNVNYPSISSFAEAHWLANGTPRNANGWKECFCNLGGEWVSTYSLGT